MKVARNMLILLNSFGIAAVMLWLTAEYNGAWVYGISFMVLVMFTGLLIILNMTLEEE